MLLAVFKQLQHVIASDDTGLARENVLTTHFDLVVDLIKVVLVSGRKKEKRYFQMVFMKRERRERRRVLAVYIYRRRKILVRVKSTPPTGKKRVTEG